jgi:hypothetical protein
MSLTAVTKKEFLDSIRSYTLIGLVVLFVVFAVFSTAIQWIPNLTGVDGNTNTLALLNSMRQPSVYLVPLVGIMVGYKAIAGERASGVIFGPGNLNKRDISAKSPFLQWITILQCPTQGRKPVTLPNVRR